MRQIFCPQPGIFVNILVSFSISTILNKNFGDITFLWYTVFVLVQISLHTIMSKRSSESGKFRITDLKKAIVAVFAVIGVGRVMALFNHLFLQKINQVI